MEIKLDISKKLIGVTGRENGRKIAREQIVPAINKQSDSFPIKIVFPGNIEIVGSSYIEGIEEIISNLIPNFKHNESICYITKDETITRGNKK